MCGIAGFIDERSNLQDLQDMTRRLSNRGPDDEGYFFQAPVGLGHRRLSIIDLSEGGHQPMHFENLIIVFNGEIYNYKEIRKELETLGYSFLSSSDTEVVLKSFHRWKEKAVERFIGMFAFAIFDKEEQELWLFRDRIGVKPLYYMNAGNRFAFASELKAFRSYLSSDERSQLDTEATSAFFRLGYVSNNRSILKSVRKLPAGHYLRFRNGVATISPYWTVHFEEDKSMLSRKEDDILDELEELVISAFRYRMVADVPVGVFLSAGIDSSLVAAVLSRHHGTIHTFTVGFREKGFDESADAKRIAEFLKTQHTDAILEADKGQEILSRFYDIYDEPHGDNSCVPTTFVSQLARSAGVKVVLSADGGDELFGGYTRYLNYFQQWNRLQQRGSLINKSAAAGLAFARHLMPSDRSYRFDRFRMILQQKRFSDFYQSILRPNSDLELQHLVQGYQPEYDSVSSIEPYNQMMEWDFHRYMVDNNLVKVDRATMYNSIEGREPFLDHRLIEFAARLPLQYKINGNTTKYLLKKLLGRYLPGELYNLPKRGFSAPLKTWMRNNYEKDIARIFHPDNFNNPYLQRDAVLKFIKRYQEKKAVNMVTLWYLYSFQKWTNKWLND
ncbi:MAG: asparagine synthase (glutamine-hydrolyzing) [Chitinophagaceae bacterium]